MFDIGFFQDTHDFKADILAGRYRDTPPEGLFDLLERHRSQRPAVFNIETTNSCNMKCIMCPRTKLMNRKIQHMDEKLFADVISQVRPHPNEDVAAFWKFVRENYGIEHAHRHEDAFYFRVISTHLTLHGYGEPLLDPKIVSKVGLCTDRGIPTYFSCVPANIGLDRIRELMASGLGVIKFSLDALSDEEAKRIRGERNNFEDAYRKILQVLEAKDKMQSSTEIVLTLIELSSDPSFAGVKKDFLRMWEGKPVYAYIKSQDNRWYYEQDTEMENRSHYERQYCEYPWTSMTVMADGSVVPCTQDYNCEMIMGNVREESLEAIWNGERYAAFRRAHISGFQDGSLKCFGRCDQKLVCHRKAAAK